MREHKERRPEAEDNMKEDMYIYLFVCRGDRAQLETHCSSHSCGCGLPLILGLGPRDQALR